MENVNKNWRGKQLVLCFGIENFSINSSNKEISSFEKSIYRKFYSIFHKIIQKKRNRWKVTTKNGNDIERIVEDKTNRNTKAEVTQNIFICIYLKDIWIKNIGMDIKYFGVENILYRVQQETTKKWQIYKKIWIVKLADIEKR